MQNNVAKGAKPASDNNMSDKSKRFGAGAMSNSNNSGLPNPTPSALLKRQSSYLKCFNQRVVDHDLIEDESISPLMRR